MDLTALTANIDGHQRKIVMSRVRPAQPSNGDSGIALEDGRTLPFTVTRAWNAPAGNYSERWYLVDPETREVLLEGPEHQVLIWGLLAWTEVTDRSPAAIPLTPGTYLVVFALGGIMGGQIEVVARPAAG